MITTGTCRTSGVTGRYWISSNSGVRGTTAPGVTARSTPTSNASGSTLVGIRGGTAMSGRKCRRPVTALAAPGAGHGGGAAGVERVLEGRRVQQRVVARGQRVNQVGQHEAIPFGVALVQ